MRWYRSNVRRRLKPGLYLPRARVTNIRFTSVSSVSPLHFPEGIGGARFRSRPLFVPGTRNKYSFTSVSSVHFTSQLRRSICTCTVKLNQMINCLKPGPQNVYSNLYSQAVTHPSTNRSQPLSSNGPRISPLSFEYKCPRLSLLIIKSISENQQNRNDFLFYYSMHEYSSD